MEWRGALAQGGASATRESKRGEERGLEAWAGALGWSAPIGGWGPGCAFGVQPPPGLWVNAWRW